MENRALWTDNDGDVWAPNVAGPSCVCFPDGWDWGTNFHESCEGGWGFLTDCAEEFKLEVLIPKEYME